MKEIGKSRLDSRFTELVVLASAVGVGTSAFGGLSHDWIVYDDLHDNIADMAEHMKEKQEKAQKNYLSMMPKYNGGKK